MEAVGFGALPIYYVDMKLVKFGNGAAKWLLLDLLHPCWVQTWKPMLYADKENLAVIA